MNRRMKRKSLLFCCLFALSLLISCVATSRTAFAAVDVPSVIRNKAILQGVWSCYKNGSVKEDINLGDYGDIKGVFGFMLSRSASENKVSLITDSDFYKKGDISCWDLFNDTSTDDNLLTYFGRDIPSKFEIDEVKNFVKGMGYDIDDSGSIESSNNNCYKLNYLYAGAPHITNTICKTNEGLKEGQSGTGQNEVYPKFSIDDKKGQVCLHWFGSKKECQDVSGEEFSGDTLLNLVNKSCGSLTCDGGVNYGTIIFDATMDGAIEDVTEITAEINDFTNAARSAVRYLSGVEIERPLDGLLIKNEDLGKRLLYQSYLTDYYNVEIECNSNMSGAGYDGEISWLNVEDGNNVVSKCFYEDNNAKNNKKEVNGLDSDGKFGKKLSLDELINEINDLPTTYSEEQFSVYLSEDEETETGDEQETKCYRAKGIVPYLVCPAISAISGIGDYVYNQVEEDFLQVRVDKLFEKDGGLETAWEIFRNFANIVFVLLFLVVIFSQLTGVGIDNYGIKKILPKLIVAAVLINVSFFICELLADLSNVLGSALKDLFSGLAKEINVDGQAVGAGQSIVAAGIAGGGALIWGLFTSGFGGVALAAATVGIAVLGVLITLVVSILVLYLILMIRNAGIVLLIAIAPVAIVCYMLPNTEKLFKKWVGLLKALLLVYPICGLLLGGGIFAGHVLASIGTTPMIIAGMVVEVLPFFFIPTILKNSLSMMGNIGSKLSSFGKSMGKRMSGSAQSAIKNSDKFKDWSGYQREQVAAKRAQRAVRRNNEDIANRIGQEENKEAKDRFETIMDGLEKGENISDENKKWYNDMKEKYQRRGWSERKTRLANERITKHESERNEDRVGTNAVAVAGERAKNRYTSDSKAIENSSWATASYIVDGGGDVWVQNEDGDYEANIDGKVQTKSGSELMREGGKVVSKSTAMARKDQIERARQTGELAAYATRAETIDKAARGARLSALENSQSNIVQNVISGNDEVLQAQYDANASKENKILGDAAANADFRKQGLSTITSVEAAQQAAEAQLTNIASQNLAAENFDARVQAGKYDVKKIRDDAVLAGAIKNINQTTNTVASNEAGEVVIDLDVAKQTAENEYKFAEAKNDINKVSKISKEYADTVEQKRFDLAEEKMHGELLQNNSRGASMGVLEEAIVGEDKNKTMAAIKDVIAKGGIEDVNKLLQKTKFSNSGVKRAVHEYMATLSMEPMMKAYGKYAAEEGNDLEYGQWLVEKDDPIGDPDGKKSLAGFIMVNGESVLQNASKDTFKFYDGDEQRALRDSLSPIQVIRGVLTARDNETRVAGNKLMAKILVEQPDKLVSALDRLSASDWAHMDASTFEVMSAALDNALNSALPGISGPVEKKIKETKEKIAKAGGTIGANMRPEVKRFFDKY